MDPDCTNTRSSRIPRPSSRGRSPSPPKGGGYFTLSPTPEQLTNASNISIQQLKDEIAQLKRKLEEESLHVKSLKHEKVKELKKIRTEEQGKTKNALEDQRYKLNQEKERALENLRAQLAKQHASEMSKILKERETFSKASRDADKERMSFTQSLQEEMRTEARDEAKKLFAAEKNRFIQEIEELNRKKRELEEQLKNESLAGRHKLDDYKRLNEEHQREIDQLKRDARKDIILLLDELKAKDRIILELERELGHQAGYASGLATESGSSRKMLNLTKMRDTWEKLTSSKAAISKKDRTLRHLGTEQCLSQSSSSLDDSKKSAHSSDENQRTETSDRVPEFSSRASPYPSTAVSAKESLIPRRVMPSRGSPVPLRGSPIPKANSKMRRSLPILSPPARSSTPIKQVTDSLQRKLREAEDARRKLERKCKMLSDELKSVKKDFPKSKRPQSPWTTEKMDLLTKHKRPRKPGQVRRSMDDNETKEREEEISRLRKQMDDQFEEIVELKQAAMAERNRQLFGRRNSLPLETQSELDVSLNSSLAISEADDLVSLGRSLSRPDLESRESLTTPSLNEKLEEAEETIQELKEKLQEVETSREALVSELHDSKEQNELLEFQLLEAAESGKGMSGKEMPLTDEILEEILRYMQTHEGREIDLSELKQQIDQLSQEKLGKLSDTDQKSLESLREILERVEVEVENLREKESDLREEVEEKTEEVRTLASKLTQLLTQLTEKDETILIINKKIDELLENEFDLSEKIKDYEIQIALLQEELLERRDKHAGEREPDAPSPLQPVVEKAESEEGEKTPGKGQADKEVQVRFRRPRPSQHRDMSGEFNSDDWDGEEESGVTFSDDDFIGDLLPDGDDDGKRSGVRDGDMGAVDEVEETIENAALEEQRSVQVRKDSLGEVGSGEAHDEENRPQGRVQVLEEENNGLLTKQRELQSEISNLKETVICLESRVFESEENAETMSKVISDQMVEIQNLRQNAENLLSKDVVEMRERELQEVIKDLQTEEKEMRLEVEKINDETRRQMEMLESERKMIEDRLQEAEGEKKLLRDALEKEKLSKDAEDRGEEGVKFYKNEVERLNYVIEELNEKQLQGEELQASLQSELQNVKQQLARQETEKEELQGRYHQLEEQRQEAENKLEMRKEELQYLLREKGEMERVQEELQSEVASWRDRILQEDEESPKSEKHNHETEMQTQEIAVLKETIENLKHENKDLISYRDEVVNLREQLEVLKKEKEAVEETLQDVSSEREKLSQELQLKEKANEVVKGRKENEKKVMELTQTVEEMERMLVEKDNERDEMGKLKDKEVIELSQKIHILHKEIELLQKRNEELSVEKEETKGIMEEKEKLLREIVSLEERVHQLQSSESQLAQEMEEKGDQLLKLEMENDKMLGEIERLKGLLEEATTGRDGNVFDELQENILQLEIEKGSLENDLLKEKSETEKLKKDIEEMEVMKKQLVEREAELKGVISKLEAFQEREEVYQRQVQCQESEINALQKKSQDLSDEVQVLENKNKKLEQSESKLFSDSFEKDAKIQEMHAKELELEEKVRKLLMEKVGTEKHLGEQDGLMDELEARKIKIGDLEDELEKIRLEGELAFDSNEISSDGDYFRVPRENFDQEPGVSERVEQPGENLSEDGDNLYSVVEQEIWEEVQVSVVRPTAMTPSVVGGDVGDEELGIFALGTSQAVSSLQDQEEESTILNRRIEMLEAEVKSQKDLLQEETLAKKKLQTEIWEMLQTQSDLTQQLTMLKDQNEGLQANMNFLKELEEETELLTAKVEKMTAEKHILETKVREVEASKAENEKKLKEKGRELDMMKEQVDAIEEGRKALMEKLKEMEDKMKARIGSLEASGGWEYSESERLDLSKELEESLKDEIKKLEERNSLLEEKLHDKTKISLDTSEMDSLLFSSDDEAEFDGRAEDVEEKVKRLEKLNHALKEQVKHLLAFQHLGTEDSGVVKEDVKDEVEKETDETEEEKEDFSEGKIMEESHMEKVSSEEDLRKQLALSEENNKYLERQLEGLRQLMQDGGFENQDVLIEKVEALEKSQKQLVTEIESLKKELAEKEDELLSTQAEMLNTERKFSVRVEELQKSEQDLLEKLEAANDEWRQQSENSMERIGELENVRSQLRQQLSIAEEQLEELQASGGFGNLSGTQQSGVPSLLDEGLGALDIGRSSFDYTEEDDEEDGSAMQQEMEVALRKLDEEEDEDRMTVFLEENEKLMGRVEELENSEVELMEKVEILEQSELAISDLCDQLKADIDRKSSEIVELREKLAKLEIFEDQSNHESKEKQGVLEEEVKHLQEQVSFMEEERKSLLSKIKEMEMERDVEEMEEKEGEETEKLEDFQEEQSVRVMLEENKVEINIKQWQAKILEEMQQVEKPVRVRTVAPYNTSPPYWKLGMTSGGEVNHIRIQIADWNLAGREEEEYPQEFADEEDFLKTVSSCVRQRRPHKVKMDFEEKILEEEQGLTGADEEGKNGERVDELGGKDLSFMREKSHQERNVVIHQNFEEIVLSPFAAEGEVIVDEGATLEEQNFKYCEEVMIGKEEVVTVQITDDVFMPLRSKNQDNTTESVELTGEDELNDGEEIYALREKIRDLEASEVILKERISELEKNEGLSDDKSEVVEKDTSRTGEESKEDLEMKIRELEDNEAVLKAKIEEMEVMQNAFEETLSQADAIVRERESEYLQKIEALESSQSDLRHLLERSNGGHQGSGDNFRMDDGSREDGEEVQREKIKELENLLEEKESQFLVLQARLEEKLESEQMVKKQLKDEIERLKRSEEEKGQLMRGMEKQLEEELAERERENTLKERITDLEEMVAKKSEQVIQLENELAGLSEKVKGDASQEGDVTVSSISGEAAVARVNVDQIYSEQSGVLQKRIEELENSEMKLITELEESLENEEKLKEEIQKMEKLMDSEFVNKDEFREKIQHLESDVEELKSKLEAAEDEKEICVIEIAGKAKALEEMQETKILMEQERDEKKAEIEELSRLGEKKDEELAIMAEDVETKSKRIEELDGIVKTLEMGVENLTSKLVEEEDKVRDAEAEMEKIVREREKVEDEASQLRELLDGQGNRSLSARDHTSHDVEEEVEKEDDAKQLRHQEDEAMEDEISTQGDVQETLSVLQEELHLANIQIEDLKRSKIALEEQLKKLRSNRRSSSMITLPEDEYQSLKARAQRVDSSEDSEETSNLNSTNDEEQFANAGKLWVKLDQTTKELRKYQELYNTTIKEVGHLKQALREVSEKHEAYLQGRRGSMVIDMVALPSSDNDKGVDHKLVQTRPLKTITSDALKVRLATDTSRSQPITLQELLEAIPEPVELGDVLMPRGSPTKSEMIAANESLFLLDSPSPLKTTSSQDALSESFLNTSMWPPDLARHEKQKAWEEIQSALTSENMSEEGDTPPLPKSMPPRTSSNLSFAETPDLPDLPPPIEISFLSDDDEFPKDEVDLDQSEVRKITAESRGGQESTHPEPPPVPPKPAAPDWLKEMQLTEWQKALKEADEMKKIQELEEKMEEKDEQLNQLKIDREELEIKAREAQDGYRYKEKLQEKEGELGEKEKQILKLKGDLKKKEAEAIPLKLQLESLQEKQIKLMLENGQTWQLKDKLERLQDQFKDKEQSMRLLEAEKMRMKEDMEEKDKKLFSKEREVEKCQEEIETLKRKLKDYENGQKQESDEDQESEKEYLKKQNERLRRQVDQLEPLKERMDNLQSQLEKGLSSQENSSSLVKKLQQAEKMLEEKTADELRLLEDNECLQKRIDNLEKEKNYRERLEADFENMQEMFNDLEHKKHQAELSVAPLKAKVSYLLKKFQEKDTVLRKMASEVAVKYPERASEIFEEIERLQDQLPVEDIQPRKIAWEEKPLSLDRKKAKSLDILNNNGSEFSGDNLERNGGVSLQDLIKEASKPTVGNFSVISDIGRSQDSLLAALPELKSNPLTGSPLSKEKNVGRRRKIKILSSDSDDTLGGLLQSDAEDNIDFPISGASNSHLPNLVSPDVVMAHSASSPLLNGTYRNRPPLLRTMKTDLGTGGKPSPLSSMDRTQPMNGLGALTSGIPLTGIGTDEAGGAIVPSAHFNGVSQSGTGMVPVVSNGTHKPTSGVTDFPSPFGKNTMLPFHHPHSKGVAPLQNGYPPSRLPHTNPVSHNSGNTPPMNGPLWDGAPRVPAPHDLSTSLSSSLPSSHVQPSSGNHHLPSGTGHSALSAGPLQPPKSLSVARMVSKHSVLLVWTLPSLDEMARNSGHEVAGYKIYVNGNLKQFVTSPHLAKALVTNLNLKTVKTFGIQTVSVHGKGSSVRQVNFTLPHSDVSQSGMSDASLSDSAREPSTDASSVVGERPKERMFMAVYSYNPMEHSPNENPERELTFKEGDLIRVQGHMRNDGFYHGMINGKKGLVPSNFIEEISISSSGKKKSRREVPRKQPHREVSKTRKEKESSHRAHSKSSQSKV